MTKAKRILPKWLKRGLISAVIAPAAFVGLTALQSNVQYGSAAYIFIHSLIWWIVAPVIIPIEKMGIYGCKAMGYIIPIFILVFIYLMGVGFGLGALSCCLRKRNRIAQQSGPAYPPQGVGSPDP